MAKLSEDPHRGKHSIEFLFKSCHYILYFCIHPIVKALKDIVPISLASCINNGQNTSSNGISLLCTGYQMKAINKT